MKKLFALALPLFLVLTSCSDDESVEVVQTIVDTLSLNGGKYAITANIDSNIVRQRDSTGAIISVVDGPNKLIVEAYKIGSGGSILGGLLIHAKVQKSSSVFEADSTKSYNAFDEPISTFSNLPNWADTSSSVVATLKINSNYYYLRDKKLNKN